VPHQKSRQMCHLTIGFANWPKSCYTNPLLIREGSRKGLIFFCRVWFGFKEHSTSGFCFCFFFFLFTRIYNGNISRKTTWTELALGFIQLVFFKHVWEFTNIFKKFKFFYFKFFFNIFILFWCVSIKNNLLEI